MPRTPGPGCGGAQGEGLDSSRISSPPTITATTPAATPPSRPRPAARSSARATRPPRCPASTSRWARATRSRSARTRCACWTRLATPPGISPMSSRRPSVAFVGDTLFAIGCGRVIEGNAQMMWQSLKKLMALPKDTHGLLRPRVHAGQRQVRAHDRAGERGAAEARQGGRPAARRRQADAADHHRHRAGDQSVPAPARAGDPEAARHGGQARVADLRRDQGAQEQGLRRVVRALAGDSQQWPRPAPCRPTSPSTIS